MALSLLVEDDFEHKETNKP
ncbi:hypothetical protein CCACVL1_27313 [Corchorus capsularis]|uniref:Uncharacterized protein n=1 Tax=Corchorus capsularis TaxID=210143 RepID=A0A1R3GB49_COCAP|nr:hypothetical protein CCACVL1_27313 [Corchorus capsularis]